MNVWTSSKYVVIIWFALTLYPIIKTTFATLLFTRFASDRTPILFLIVLYILQPSTYEPNRNGTHLVRRCNHRRVDARFCPFRVRRGRFVAKSFHRRRRRSSALTCGAGGRRSFGRLGILQPPDLRGRSVALVVACRNAENDRRFGCLVNVRRQQRLIRHRTLIVRSAVDPHECKLRRLVGLILGILRLDRQVNGVLQNVAGGRWWRFPR